ncbi:TPA: hypothetical protein ACNVAS_002296 [Citrobacter amalonaticus]|uniref:hypothetical protein n=1 Tax=Citrobacter amalonaticus TaxID=35703 RepID=UPI00292BF5B8|nr:hypothetical protein [Citrobacter amalonaticus]EKW3844974.1 hypothetical protein [Citrobacter amalonaticus]EKX8495314.1 hypothetical protein [Citrobacter amalonaticus]MDV0785629.1 hypothetical protein [Citrobacter amalonaticus]MEB0641692.1 hypothetical protein [Citrobacter amalonaticus]
MAIDYCVFVHNKRGTDRQSYWFCAFDLPSDKPLRFEEGHYGEVQIQGFTRSEEANGIDKSKDLTQQVG